MSLQVWLPLNGNLNNQGLADVTVTNNGATVDANGKIGSCYSFDGTDDRLSFTPMLSGASEWSVAAWIKPVVANNGSKAWCSFEYSTYWQITCYGTTMEVRDDATGLSGTRKPFSFGTIEADTWVHLVGTYKSGTVTTYKNGVQISTGSTGGSVMNTMNGGRIGSAVQDGYYWNGKMNDFRIYDHALSPREVAEIAKGLVCHYPLSENITPMNNCYSNPTFSSSSGWSHWGGSGHAGTSGQTTDSDYIFRPNQSQAHWVADGSTATKPYLLYQSPSFSGGFRSMQCICKEENGIEITEDICYPDWNARISGSMAVGHWTSITSLGNGFYWCKVEGLQQDGSNNLIGVYVKPGYKVYFSEMYCENSREICADPFLTDRTTIYDTSGFGYNGTAYNVVTSQDTPRYSMSTVFNGSSYIKCESNMWMAQGNNLTVSIWAYNDDWASQTGQRIFSCTEGGGFNIEQSNTAGYYSFTINVFYNASLSAYTYVHLDAFKPSDLSPGWHMLTGVLDSSGVTFYVDGQQSGYISYTNYGIHYYTNARLFLGCEANVASPYQPYFTGKESDFRIYATALSAEEIKELYDTSVTIDKNGNVYAREVQEI